ncbi:hypothetical protein JMJ35_006495 [Cladonia borealis]|uniref:Zn(2)-C6 fungal-type domain-containing protein n=1 Tax=Cladonia borealis TaxID=184061 RepID=A0AA39V0C1_9LECA|nr:hypothetical protein JMJ35_006495 [Cladonia borealis]
MVGVITSNRCDNCRKRKKKCGEQRPSCDECIRAGWSCPGYKTDWKFVDETSRLTKYYLRRKYVYDAIEFDSEEAESTLVDEDSTLNGIEVVWKTFHILNSNALAKSTVPQSLGNNRLGSALVYCLDSKVKGGLIPLRIVGSFFEFIPARLGRNTALDDAVSCICAIYCGNPVTPYNMHKEVCTSYVKALSSLRTCLDDDAARMDSETLCASILLQMCELVVNIDIGEWSQLARGTAYLLYSRGVHRYTSDFDHALLESQLTYVSMKYREHCFLCYPEWQNLLSQNSSWPFQSSQPQSLTLRTLLATIIVSFPSLIIDCSVLVESQTYQSGWEERLELLIQKAVSMLTNVTNWLHLKAEPYFMSNTLTYLTPTMDYEEAHINYPDVLIGVLDCVANTAILAIERLLRHLCLARPQPCYNSMGPSWPQERGWPWLSDDPEQMKPRCRRAISALNFVKAESTLAAKPLEFGLQQVQSADSSLGD